MRRSLLLVLSLLLASVCSNAQVTFNSTSYSVPQTTSAIVSGDFNRDGKPDLAVLNGQGASPEVTIFLATTAGHYSTTGTSYPLHNFPSDIRTADINNDGNLDLIVSFNSMPVISILYGNGDGTFRAGPDIATTYNVGLEGFDLGDFNNDGNIDLAFIECDGGNVCDMRAMLGNGKGGFTQSYKIQMTGAARSILARDMTGDGKLDLILIRTSDVLLFGGDGTGRFTSFTKFTPPGHCTNVNTCVDKLDSLVVADFNNDGRLDFAVKQAHTCGSSCGSNDVYVYKNTGTYAFSLATDVPFDTYAGGMLLAADLNGDGNYDLLTVNGDHFGPGNGFAQGAGNFTFTAENTNLLIDTNYVTARDLNLDSRHDVVESMWEDNAAAVELNSSAYTNCNPPSSANIAAKICTPAASASVASPVLIRASGNSPAGVQRLEVWVDGVKKYEKWNDQLAKSISMTSGSHRVTVVAVDMYKGTAKTSVTVNVQ